MVPEEHGANQTEWVSEYRPNGERVFLKDVRMLANVFPYPWQLVHRVDLHNALKELATSSDGKGPPAILHLRSRVRSVDIDAPELMLEDGSRHSGDLILGADGIHSSIRTALVPDRAPPAPSGSSAFRFLIPVDAIRSDPKTAHFVENTGELRLLYGNDRRIVIYPCRNNTVLNFVALHPDEETEARTDDWNQTASKVALLSCFSSYPEDVKALLDKVPPQEIKLWKLLDHDELGKENWIHGKVALLGDAAHGFLPHQGQGAAQAIEDGAAIGALFPLGTRPSDIPRRLELYVEARYDRATMVQEFTRQSAFKTPRGKHGGNVIDPMQFTEVNFNHDAFDYAHGILIRDLNKNALYRRMPLSFGPPPGPRQDCNGWARGMGKPTYKTSYITFKTHKSYLSTLLPTENFLINTKGSWATATFSVSRLENLDWLGGRGYSFFGLYIHEVVYTASLNSSTDTKNGDDTTRQELKGNFLPILFENKPDPIITGREELGFSKMFATLDEGATPATSFALSAGWEGTEFCHFSLEDLVKDPAAESVLQTPLLHYKAVPSSKAKGDVDGEYVTTYPALPVAEGERRWRAGRGEIKFTDLQGEELESAFPTLVNIVEGLRNIKIVEVVGAGVQASG